MNWLITCFIAGVTQSVLAGTNEHPSSELTGDEEVYIFDVDGGADDIFGLVLSLLNPSQGRILAITTVFGDTDVFNATENVLRTLQLVNRTEVPVYRGSQGGLVFTPPSDFYYGRDGIGDNNWNETVRLHAENTPAAVFLADTVNALPGKVTVVSTGPLTNIALAQHLNPSFFKRLRHLYIMGGAYQGRGNVRPGVEFNFFEDPHAAEYVLLESHNQTVINLFPMETAPNIPLEWRTKTLEQIDSKYLKFLDIAERNATYDTYWTPFDESTMATAFNTKLISEAFKADGSVLTEGGDAKGLLVIDYSSNQHNLNVVTKIDREAFQDYVYATLSGRVRSFQPKGREVAFITVYAYSFCLLFSIGMFWS